MVYLAARLGIFVCSSIGLDMPFSLGFRLGVVIRWTDSFSFTFPLADLIVLAREDVIRAAGSFFWQCYRLFSYLNGLSNASAYTREPASQYSWRQSTCSRSLEQESDTPIKRASTVLCTCAYLCTYVKSFNTVCSRGNMVLKVSNVRALTYHVGTADTNAFRRCLPIHHRQVGSTAEFAPDHLSLSEADHDFAITYIGTLHGADIL